MKPLNDVLNEVKEWKTFKGYFCLGKSRFIVVIRNGIKAQRDDNGVINDSEMEEDEAFDEPVFSISRIIRKPYPHIYSAEYEQAIVAFPELLLVDYSEVAEDDLIKELYTGGDI